MKRMFVTASLVTLLAAPLAAQFDGMPVWNSPKGGTGVTINGDFAMPSEEAGGGSAIGGRASIGLANLTLTGGLASWTPEDADETFTSFGGGAAFRVIGGSLMPVAINIIVGAARRSEVDAGVFTFPATTTVVAGAGLSAGLPTPGVSIEPYVTVSNRLVIADGDTDSAVGVTFGANVGFGMLGLHLAYDTMSSGGVSRSIFGIGAHVALKAPI